MVQVMVGWKQVIMSISARFAIMFYAEYADQTGLIIAHRPISSGLEWDGFTACGYSFAFIR
jgi:hypothetical protein